VYYKRWKSYNCSRGREVYY